jgi:hypothetical protein
MQLTTPPDLHAKGSAPALSGHTQFGHREAFVTSVEVTGNLGGVAGADLACQSAAAAANVYAPGTFALLNTSAPGSNLTDRIEFDGPWYRRDGLLFAHDKAELTGGAVTLPLNVTDSGAYLGISVALTGATELGAPSGFDCAGWTSTGNSQATSALVNSVALFNSNGTNWLSAAVVSCAATHAPADLHRWLFCVSDSDVLFHAEFEALPPVFEPRLHEPRTREPCVCARIARRRYRKPYSCRSVIAPCHASVPTTSFDVPDQIAYFNNAYLAPQLKASRNVSLPVCAQSYPWERTAASFSMMRNDSRPVRARARWRHGWLRRGARRKLWCQHCGARGGAAVETGRRDPGYRRRVSEQRPAMEKSRAGNWRNHRYRSNS